MLCPAVSGFPSKSVVLTGSQLNIDLLFGYSLNANYLIEKCGLFIGNDSGPMHAAAAQKVRTIGLFGCNLPVRFRPFGKNGYYLYKKDNQDACINVHKGQVGECKHGIENACVMKIQVNDVISLIDKIIKNK